MMLTLQRSAGNAAVARMFARAPVNREIGADVQGISPRRFHHVQRDVKGLLLSSHVKGVSTRWLELWRSKKSATIRVLIGDMIDVLNAELKSLHIPQIKLDPVPSDTEAKFRRQDWQMSMNLDVILQRKLSVDDKVSSLSLNDIAKVGNSLFHESRHAEQSFLVARTRAKTQPNPDLLAKSLEIPIRIANAATLAGAPGKNDPTNEQIEEWAAFEPGGRHFKYWKWNEAMQPITAKELQPILKTSPQTISELTVAANQINRAINVLGTQWSFPYERLQELEELSKPEKVDATVLASLRRITLAFDKLVLSVDRFRDAVILLKPAASSSTPEDAEVQRLDAINKWMEIPISQVELQVVQGDAYKDYPHEIDARSAGKAVEQTILSAARPARRP